MIKPSQYISSKHDKSIRAAESKACNLQECKGMGLECANAIGDTEIFGVVPICLLSYIHVGGDFNPRRVTVARVHGGLHPRRVHEEATLSIPSWPSPMKDLPH